LRLGRAKALARINKLNLIERTIGCLSTVSQAVLVVTSQEQFSSITAVRLKAKVVVDLYPEGGALGGVYTGLATADSHHSLVVACDMPFLNRDLLCYLMDLAPNFDVVVPKLDGKFEPLHAVYSKDCLAPIKEILREGSLEILRLFDLVKIRYVGRDEIAKFDPQFLSFFNINTPEDLKKAEELIMQREQNLTVRKNEFQL
jgi:molybdopterin-guanine dinucleotide biosynthesis protein A